MTALFRSVRLTLRKLLRAPGLSTISILALALGIGLTGTMFSITYAALFRGLPFDEPDQLVLMGKALPERGIEFAWFGFLEFRDLRERLTSFEELAGYRPHWVNLSDEADYPARVSAARVTPAVFDLLRVRPAMGRLFDEEDAGPDGPSLVLISHGLWQSRYGGDPGILERSIRLDGEAYRVIGVMPPEFQFPERQDLWVPFSWDPAEVQRGQGSLLVMGRLRDGVGIDRARGEMNAVLSRLAREHPDTDARFRARVQSFTLFTFGQEEYAFLWTMVGAGVFVLLIACANVANLLLARAVDAAREIAVRSALGASRWRVVGNLLLEALVLALVGGAAGVGLAHLGVSWFVRELSIVTMPFWFDVRVDLPILAFLVGAVGLSALLAGGIPAWRAAAVDANEVLKDESRGASSLQMGRTGRVMVVVAVVLAFPLLTAAGLMINSVTRLNQDPGFVTSGVFVGRIGLPGRDYPDAESRRRFWRQLLERIESEPGVQGAAYASRPPGTGTGFIDIALEGREYPREQDHPRVRHVAVSPGLFALLGVAPSRGRVFDPGDREGALPVAVVNESYARRFFPGEDPLDRRIRFPEISEEGWRTIVGVVPDLRMGGGDTDEPEGVYVPMGQWQVGFGHAVVRLRGDPLALAPAFRQEVARLDPHLPVYRMTTLDQALRQEAWFVRVFGWIFSVLGGVALFLAAVGLYGVMSFSVSRRTREVGVRMALGADAGEVLRLMLRKGLRQVLLGLVIGLVLALLVSRFLQLVLYGVNPRDPITYATVAAVLLLAGFLASLVPALRAAKLDPMEALRYE